MSPTAIFATPFFTGPFCLCGHEQHDGACGKTRRGHESLPPTEPCDCVEFRAVTWGPCGAVWYYGKDSRPEKLGEY